MIYLFSYWHYQDIQFCLDLKLLLELIRMYVRKISRSSAALSYYGYFRKL